MPMERAPFGCLTDKPSRYMITPMLNCVTPVTIADQCLQTVVDVLKLYRYEAGTRKKCFIPDSLQSRLVSVPLKYFIPTLMEHTHPA